jgi:hypothetical protein
VNAALEANSRCFRLFVSREIHMRGAYALLSSLPTLVFGIDPHASASP